MHRLAEVIKSKSGSILNVYFTAGHPTIDSMVDIIASLEKSGADLIEIGMPYTDPLADGPTIQKSSEVALKNGISLERIFNGIKDARAKCQIPLILMGYFNQVLQFGVEAFLQQAQEAGVDGMIIPDLPMDVYEKEYQDLFEKYNIAISFLITPETSDKRIQQADRLSSGFVYMVSQTSITGSAGQVSDSQLAYYQRIQNLHLKSPKLIGFGIHNNETFKAACHYSDGAIVGSAFIRAIDKSTYLSSSIEAFIKSIRS